MAFLRRWLRHARPRFGLLLLAGLLLSSCERKPDDLFRACAALTGAFEPVGETIVRAPPDLIGPLSVQIAWRWGVGQRDGLICHFAARAQALKDPPLRAVETLRGGPLSDRELAVLEVWGRMAGEGPKRFEPSQPVERPILAGSAYGLQQLLNALTVGSLYALIAVGYALIFSLLEIVNFAFGELAMVGSILAVIVILALGMAGVESAWILLPAALIAVLAYGGVLGAVIDRTVYRPIGRGNRLSPLVAAIGLSLVVQNSVLIAQGARGKILPPLIEGGWTLHMGDSTVHFSFSQLAIILLTAVVGLLLHNTVQRTRFGRDLRACAADPTMAGLLGVPVNGVIARAFALSTALAGVGGLVSVVYYGQTDHSIGLALGFKALTGAILGGIGTLTGAMAGAMLVGLVEILFAAFISNEMRDLAVFVLLVGVLILRPTGLFGTRTETSS
jgi:branched-chain amino acid transport system permease protein